MLKENPYYQEKTITQDKFGMVPDILSEMSQSTQEQIKSDNFDASEYELTVTKLVETDHFVTIAMYLKKRD